MKVTLIEKDGKQHDVDVEDWNVGAVARLSTVGGRNGVFRVFTYAGFERQQPIFREVNCAVVERLSFEARS